MCVSVLCLYVGIIGKLYNRQSIERSWLLMYIIIGGTVTFGSALGIRSAVPMNKRFTPPPLLNASHTIAHHPCQRGLGSDTTGWSTIGGLPGLSAAGPGSPPIVLYIKARTWSAFERRSRTGSRRPGHTRPGKARTRTPLGSAFPR